MAPATEALERLRATTLQFAHYTDALLVAAEQGHWQDFVLVCEARDQLMNLMEQEAGDALLQFFPEYRELLQQALDKNQQVQLLAAAQRDQIGEQLSTFQQQRRLRMTYR